MNRRKRLIGTVVSLVLAITLMGFGVYAATSVASKISSEVSFISKDIKCTIKVDVDGGKYLSGGVGTNEQEYRHKTQSVNNENVNAAHTLTDFTMGHYTFDPTQADGKTITYTITIINNGNNEIKVDYNELKIFETIPNILQVTKTNMQSVKTVAIGDDYEGKIELVLLDSSADIEIKDIDITYEVSKYTAPPPTPLTSFTFGTPISGKVPLTKFKGTETEVVIPKKDSSGNLITSIGEEAFDSNTKITSVTIPAGVTTIGNSAFRFCSALESVTIPAGVTTIGEYAFYYCSKLTSVTIPAGVTTIGEYAFYYCKKLNSVTIPAGVTTIRNYVFAECNSLTSVTIPAGVTTIGDSVFASCKALTSVTILGGVTSIGNNAFFSCLALESVTIPDSLTSIGNNAFSSCLALTSVTIPGGVTSIGDSAFYGCSKFTSITIPAGVTSIGAGAFGNCRALLAINVDIGNSNYTSDNGVLLNKAKTTLIQCPGTKTSYNIPAGATTIGNKAFWGCSVLISVIIPNSVTSIGEVAFYNCRALTSVTIPEGVTTIGKEAFLGCSSLTSVTIPAGVTTIGSYAFSGCSALSSVYFERTSVFTSLGSGCFNGLKSGSKLYFKNSTVMDQFTTRHYTSSITTKAL